MLPPLLTIFLLALTSCHSVALPYRFLLEDGEHDPSYTTLHGALEQPRPGDIVWALGQEFVLEDTATYRLAREGDHRVWRSFTDGRRELIALRFEGSPEDLELTKDHWQTLRGLTIDRWTPEAAARLAWIDPTRCLVSFGVFVDFEKLPDLPRRLRYLDIAWTDLVDLSGIERLEELRYLRMPREQELKSLKGVARLRELRYVKFTGSGIADLTALGGHPNLRRIEAPCSPITALPRQRLPRLERFVACGSGCPATEADRFRTQQPGALVAVTYGRVLRGALRGAVRMRIRTGSTCHPRATDRELFATTDAAEIAELVALLRPREGHSKVYMIPGCGLRTCEFFDADGNEILEVGLLELVAMRSSQIWEQPPGVAAEVRDPLRSWMAARGVDFPK